MGILRGIPLREIEERCSALRRDTFGRKVDLCSIVNARRGACTENCAFCAQSRSEGRPMLDLDDLNSAHRSATRIGVNRFSAVTSGRDLSGVEFQRICRMAEIGRDLCPLCASLGILDGPRLRRLKDAGVSRYHHNLETSRSFFGKVCTTHSWQERAETVEKAMEEGLSVCSGGIMGVGEEDGDRVELAFSLKELEVDSIALNFFIPVEGSGISPDKLTPEQMLRIVALFRLVNPDSEVRICAGREMLGEEGERIFDLGATGIMTGELLTTEGSLPRNDIELISRAGYTV